VQVELQIYLEPTQQLSCEPQLGSTGRKGLAGMCGERVPILGKAHPKQRERHNGPPQRIQGHLD
jgi:hypothetical protein